VDTITVPPREDEVYVLRRVHPDGGEEHVSEHPDFGSGWSAGTSVVTVEDKQNAYALCQGQRRVAKFGRSRLMPQLNAERASEMAGMLS
jgi:hypothetical protein